MAIYLGDGKARITYASQPVYCGGQKISRIYAGDDLIYPDGVPEYLLAEWYSYPEQQYGEGSETVLVNEAGTCFEVNAGAKIVDAIVLLEYDSDWESGNTDDWKYAYSFGIAIKGTNFTSIQGYDFSGYYGKYVVKTKTDGWQQSFHWKTSGSYTIWTTYINAVYFPSTRGDMTKDMALAHSSDLRRVSRSAWNSFVAGK